MEDYYPHLCGSAMLAVITLASLQETLVGMLFDLHSKWRGGIPNEEPNTKVSEPEIGGRP